jgi:hypothetical protein
MNPNLIGPPKTGRGGLSDRLRASPFLTTTEAGFVNEKRSQGVADSQIAKMLGCSLLRIQRHWPEPAEPKPTPDPDLENVTRKVITAVERKAIDRAAPADKSLETVKF